MIFALDSIELLRACHSLNILPIKIIKSIHQLLDIIYDDLLVITT